MLWTALSLVAPVLERDLLLARCLLFVVLVVLALVLILSLFAPPPAFRVGVEGGEVAWSMSGNPFPSVRDCENGEEAAACCCGFGWRLTLTESLLPWACDEGRRCFACAVDVDESRRGREGMAWVEEEVYEAGCPSGRLEVCDAMR